MHSYYSTCINILVIFSPSLSLLLSPHSPSHFNLCDQHHSTAARRTRLIYDVDQHHTIAVDQHQTTRRLIKSLPITLHSLFVFLI